MYGKKDENEGRSRLFRENGSSHTPIYEIFLNMTPRPEPFRATLTLTLGQPDQTSNTLKMSTGSNIKLLRTYRTSKRHSMYIETKACWRRQAATWSDVLATSHSNGDQQPRDRAQAAIIC